MGRNGSGTYSRTQSDYVYDTVIDESKINSELNDIATELTNSVDKDGQTPWAGNMQANSNKIGGLSVGTANGDSVTVGQVQNGGISLATSISGTDTITGALTPAIASYVAGLSVYFVSAGANTGAVTINLNSLGAKAVTKSGTTALASGDIPSGAVVQVTYDGTRFQLASAGVANNSVDGSKIAMGSDAQGDILYYNGTDYARLGFGTSGYFLKTQGTGANPAWAEVTGGGPSLGTDSVIRTNAKTIAENITFAGTENGSSVGPISITGSYVVTVTSGSTWTIV
jgi:hypothetical protein